MPPLSDTQHLFLELLCSAIWDREPQSTLFEGVSPETWGKVIQMASEQASIALVADKILSLPETCLPPYEKCIMILRQVNETRQLNTRLNKFLVTTIDGYESKNWPVILLKGAGNATHYPNPLLRMPGDIDLYFCNPAHYEQANAWMKSKGYPHQIDNRARQEVYSIGPFMLDHHKFMLYFEHKPFNSRWLKLVNEEISNPDIAYATISGREVRVLHPELNLLFVFIHLLLHFIQGGVGMKQVCDWVLMSDSLHQKIDKTRFAELVRQFELTYAMELFARLAVEYLQASPEIFISLSEPKDKHVELIYQEIMDGGNFGFNRKASRGGWKNAPSLYWLMWTKNRRLQKIAPFYTKSIVRSRMKAHAYRLLRLTKKSEH